MDDIQKMSFEQSYAALEKTVQLLEAGNLPLAEMIVLYQRGMALSKQCNQHLEEAELIIQRLTSEENLSDFET